MSLLCGQSDIFPQTDELNSELFWVDGPAGSALLEETLRFFEGGAATLGSPSAFLTNHLPSFEDDHLRPPLEHVDFPDFGLNACNMPPSVLPENLYAIFSSFTHPLVSTTDCSSLDPVYQDIYRELFHDNYDTHAPSDTTTTYEAFQPALATTSTHIPSTTVTHLSTAPILPSTMAVYAPCFDHTPQIPPIDNATIASPPPTSPSVSSRCSGSSGSDGDADHVPTPDNGQYRPAKPTAFQNQKKDKINPRSKYPHPAVLSPPRSTSKSKKSSTPCKAILHHPYGRGVPSRNFQCEDAALLVDNGSNLQCPVPGCGHIQGDKRGSDLRRHIRTHGRWREPEKWVCCGVGIDKAHIYCEGISQDMTDKERIKAGAYMFRGRLMIGGCMMTFSRRDSLKRHVDNPDIPCAGHMDSYFF